MKSLARPGGNITGLSNMGWRYRRQAARFALHGPAKGVARRSAGNPHQHNYRAISESVQAGAQNAGVKVLIAEARTAQEIEPASLMMSRENAGAVIVGAAPLFTFHRPQIARLAIKYKMPSIFGNRDYVEAAGLMGYGYKITEDYLRVASYVDQPIFRSSSPRPHDPRARH